MFKKNAVFFLLIYGVMPIFLACSAKECPPPPVPFTPEGSWEVVSIDNKSVENYFALFGGDFSDIETTVAQNDFVFFPNGSSWYWTLVLDIKADMGGGLALLPKVELAGEGEYTYSDTTRTMVIVQNDLSVQLEPEDFWMSAGVSKEAFKSEVTRTWLFGKVENWRVQRSGRTLILTNSSGIKQVLRQKF